MAKGSNRFFSNWIVRNILGAIVLIAVLIIGAQIAQSLITRHGKTVTAPDFTNMTVAEAQEVAREAQVNVKVTDSVFIKRLGAGMVYRQSPKAGATVKKGRSIFLTINSIVPRKTVMPNLVGYSFGEATAELRNRGLALGRLSYVRDIATNNVLYQKQGGKDIAAGDLVVSGSEIDLVLGLGPDGTTTSVPKVIGMKFTRAVDTIHDSYLNLGRVTFDPGIRNYSDSTNAVVYKQDNPGASRTPGGSVNIWLTLDPEKIPAQ